MGHPHSYSPDLRMKVIEYYIDNHSLTECANHFNVSRSFCADHVRKAGATRSVKNRYEMRDSGLENGRRWKGGKSLGCKPGYVSIYTGFDNGKSTYRTEHLMVAERVLGRSLNRGEIVHHINGNGLDNRNENLLICNRSYHAHLHQEMAKRYQQEHFS